MLAPGAASTDIHMNARHSYCILEVTQKKKEILEFNKSKKRRKGLGWGVRVRRTGESGWVYKAPPSL